MIKEQLINHLKSLPKKDRNLDSVQRFLKDTAKQNIDDLKNLSNTFYTIQSNAKLTKAEMKTALDMCINRFQTLVLASTEISQILYSLNIATIVGADKIFTALFNNLDDLKESVGDKEPSLGAVLVFMPIKMVDNKFVFGDVNEK